MTRRHDILRFILTCALLGQSGAALGSGAFRPGHEGEVVALLRPNSDEDLVLARWSLTSLEAGPACEVRLGFESGAGDSVSLTLRPSAEGQGSFRFLWSPTRPDRLGAAAEALIRGNDPGDFFRDACIREEAPVAARTSGRSSGDWFAMEVGILPRLLLVLALSLLGLAVLDRRREGTPATATIPRGWSEPRWVKAVFIAGLGVRLLAMFYEPSHYYEAEQLPPTTWSEQLWTISELAPFFHVDGLTTTGKVFHTPALRLVLHPWHLLGDAVGLGGTLLWLRLPNLLLAGWLMVLLLRMGRHLGRRGAGRAAVCLFAFLPTTVDLSLQMGHYLPEAVLSAWFLERLLAATRVRQPVWRRVAAIGAAALWSGYITWPLVGIGALAGTVHLWRSDRRRDALAFVLAISALATPLIGTALDAGRIYDSACVSPETLAAPESVVPVYDGHPIFDVSEPSPAGIFLAPWRIGAYIHGRAVAAIAMAGLLLLLILRWRRWEVRLSVIVLLFYGLARTRMTLTLDQLRLLVPLLLLLPAWGFSLVPELRLRGRGLPGGRHALAVFTALALGVGAFAPVSSPHSGRFVLPTDFYPGLIQRIGGQSLWTVRAAVETGEDRGIPVLLPLDDLPLLACCCHGLPTHGELNRCLNPPRREGFPDDLLVGSIGSREVVRLRRFGCDDVVRLLGQPAWQHDDFFVLLPVTQAVDDVWPRCLEASDVRCALQVETPPLRLWRCGPDPDTAPSDAEERP